MNFISPEVLMENAMKKHYFKKPDDIYPPTEQDFDNSLHRFVNDKRNINTQRVDELLAQHEEEREIQNPSPPKRETFYIPKPEISIPSKVEHFVNPTEIIKQIDGSANPKILIVIIIIMILVIVYLYCKVENLQTLNKMYEIQLQNKSNNK